MTFKQRLPYFLGGLTIGIIVVTFFLGKKETTFDYLPNSRVLKNIRIKAPVFSSEVLTLINSKKIDSTAISQILKNGDVDIRNKIKLDSCTQYIIKGSRDLKNITLTVINCESTAIIKNIVIE
ncbi:hypothetical protein [Lutibacter sp.]|uniref:hypothetical protein n=1 Tax=Lutibacter sp. TaxID=1925666 RepID=UPI003564370F